MPEFYDSFKTPIVVAAVEGPSDIRYLKEPLEASFRRKYGSTCKLIPITDLTGNPEIDEPDFVATLQDRIEERLSGKEYLIDEDVAVMIDEIVYIIDIDEAYVDDSLIIDDPSHAEFFYTRGGIHHHPSKDVVRRNVRKRNRIQSLLGIDRVTVFRRSIPFSLYFYSVNIDDFHHDDALNWDDAKKNREAALFERHYLQKKSPEGKIKLFKELFEKRNPDDFPAKYIESWDYIKNDNHSLNRCSNVFLILDRNNRKK